MELTTFTIFILVFSVTLDVGRGKIKMEKV